jgi:dipeptidyl aminopeptidase/acylaminoacyl peptidase
MQSYLKWRSALSLETVFGDTQSFAYPSIDTEFVYFLRQTDQGDTQLVRSGVENINPLHFKVEQVSPQGFNVKTRINEYGGKPYRISQHGLLMVNDADKKLYCLSKTSPDPVPVDFTRQQEDGGPIAGFGDFQFAGQDRVVSIIDRKPKDGLAEHTMAIEATAFKIDGLESNSKNETEQAICLREGADFYSNLVVSPNGSQIAWVEWDHPNMPWDDTRAFVANLIEDLGELTLANVREIEFSDSASICQLEFADEDILCFAADFKNSDGTVNNYSNLYAVDLNHDQLKPVRLSDFEGEFSYPHWQYTDARVKSLGNGLVAGILSEAHGDKLVLFDLTKGIEKASQRTLNNAGETSWFQSLDSNAQGGFVVRQFGEDHLVKLSLFDGDGLTDLCMQDNPLPEDAVARAQHIDYPTRDEARAYAYFYPPCNPQEVAESTHLPPLIVMVHGGPTARAYGFLDLQKQFWTSNGFAVLDVNHRGSSGYGRSFRDALYGGWGKTDTNDIADAINYLLANNMVDPDGVLIRGKSAGGYAVLCALTQYASTFAGGACYYGIGNLVTLCELTHKFEKHYTDRLVGEPFDKATALDSQSQFQLRSPLNYVDNIACPIVIFQGSDDQVVPPELAKEMVSALEQNSLTNYYFEYPNEGHGFRKLETNLDAWQKELDFYREVLIRESN